MSDFSDILKQVRESDEQVEVQKNKENETLHHSRIQKYLDEHDVTPENFDDKFNFDSALEILRMKKTRGEAVLEQELVSAKEYLDSLGKDGSEMMSDWDHDTFASDLDKLLTKYDAHDHEKSINIAHQKYLLIRNLAYKRIQILGHSESKREEEKVKSTSGFKEGLTKKWKEIKDNYRQMNDGQKAVAVGALVIGTIWLFSQSDNPKIQKVKDYAWKGLKLAGAGVGINYVWKLFTGKTAINALDDYASSTAGSEGFWKESFKTDDKNAEIMQRSFVYMENKDVLDLARRYRSARGSKSKKVELSDVPKSDMTSEEIYIALDTFFNRFPVETIEKKYKNEKPAHRDWKTVTATELAEDGRLEIEGNLWDRAYENVTYGLNNSFNWLYGGGRHVPKFVYEKWTGEDFEDMPPHEFKEWFQKFFEHKVPTADKLKEHVQKETRAKSSKNLVDLLDHGHTEKNVQYLKVAGDAMYTMTSVHLGNLQGNKNAVGEAWNTAFKNVEEFYGEQFPEYKDNINKFIVPETGACVVDEQTFVLFARMPLPGTPEFHALNSGTRKNIDMMEDKGVETFEGNMTFSKLEKWEQDKFRILYGLDSSQIGADTDKIFAEITRKYEALAVPILKMKQDILTDEALRDEILKKAEVQPKLIVNKVLLGTAGDHEKVAASQIEGKENLYRATQEELRRTLGYKVRLAILGDEAARKDINYNPDLSWGIVWTDTGLEHLLKKYKDWCLKYVELKNQGRDPKQVRF